MVVAPVGGEWALRWNHRAPVGPGQGGQAQAMPKECAGGTILPWCTAVASNTALVLDGKGGWSIVHAGTCVKMLSAVYIHAGD